MSLLVKSHFPNESEKKSKNSVVIKQGNLKKRKLWTRWRDVWVVLEDERLFIFKHENVNFDFFSFNFHFIIYKISNKINLVQYNF